MTDARDTVKAQYEEWVYPLPIPDLAEAISGGLYDRSDPALIRRKLWPRNVEPAALDILVAGCGSNQAAHYAFTNPESHVVGIDISATSLDHQRLLKEKHQLGNLELWELPVEQVDDLNQSFDFIVSTGVLHHLHVARDASPLGFHARSQRTGSGSASHRHDAVRPSRAAVSRTRKRPRF